MIEALIRDDKRLICVITIQDAPEKDSLNVDIFIPSKSQTLSGVMPAGGEPAQQVARAIMTVFPVSALPADVQQKLANKNINEEIDRRLGAGVGMPILPGKPPTPSEAEHGDYSDREEEEIPKATNPYSVSSTEMAWAEIDRRNDELTEREKSLQERERKLREREIELVKEIKNFRKSQGEADNSKCP